jgi:hypothetical protein
MKFFIIFSLNLTIFVTLLKTCVSTYLIKKNKMSQKIKDPKKNLLILAAIVLMCTAMYFMSKQDQESKKVLETVKNAPTNSENFQQYSIDVALDKNKGKAISLTGTIVDFDSEPESQISFLHLQKAQVSGKDISYSIYCIFTNETDRKKVDILTKGRNVIVKGILESNTQIAIPKKFKTTSQVLILNSCVLVE